MQRKKREPMSEKSENQKNVDIQELRVGVTFAGMLIAAAVGLGWWINGQMSDMVNSSDAKFKEIRIETTAALNKLASETRQSERESRERMERVERNLEALTLGLDGLKKSAAQDAASYQERTAGRWSRLQEFMLCERHAMPSQKKNGMCGDILHMPQMNMASSFVPSWQPVYEQR